MTRDQGSGGEEWQEDSTGRLGDTGEWRAGILAEERLAVMHLALADLQTGRGETGSTALGTGREEYLGEGAIVAWEIFFY